LNRTNIELKYPFFFICILVFKKIDEKCGGADYAKEGYDCPIYV